jgi:hypothetical protein
MNSALRKSGVALLIGATAISAGATCGPIAFQEGLRSPSGDWDDVYGQAAGLLLVHFSGPLSGPYGCFDAMGTLGGPNDLTDRFQIKVEASPYFGEVVLTQVYMQVSPPVDDLQGGVNQETTLSLSRVETPDVPIFTTGAYLSPRLLLSYGTYVITMQTAALQDSGGFPGRYYVGFVVEHVPEPATYGLWLCGLALVAGIAQRRRATAGQLSMRD